MVCVVCVVCVVVWLCGCAAVWLCGQRAVFCVLCPRVLFSVHITLRDVRAMRAQCE